VLAFIALPVMPIQVWMAVGGAVAAAALVGALIVISRGERAAGGFGRTSASILRRLRPSIDPDGWSAAMVRFQQQSAAGLFRKIGLATPTMIGFVVVDGIVLVTCLRFVGIPGEYIGYLAVVAALLSLYPLTIFPFAGLGVLDAALIVLINAEGVADPTDLIAAMVIWRAATILLPLLPGLAAISAWRRGAGRSATESA